MQTVKIKDKEFSVSISEAEIRERVCAIAKRINSDLEGTTPIFIAVLNGSFIFAADLLREITIPCEIAFVRMASYTGTVSTGQVKEIMGLTKDIEGRTVVIVEDIIDSGLTMKEMLQLLQKKHPAAIHIASLLTKPNNLKDIEGTTLGNHPNSHSHPNRNYLNTPLPLQFCTEESQR